MLYGLCITGLAALLAAAPAVAQDSRISVDRDSLGFTLNGQRIEIVRSGPACPPACVQPMRAADGIESIAELEVLDFLEGDVTSGLGLLVDARLPDGFASGTLPGAVNIPAATLRTDNPYRDDLMTALGVRGDDFSTAFDLVVFAGGADSADAPEALRSLLDAGYPPGKLKYYRGGLSGWSALGLTVAAGG